MEIEPGALPLGDTRLLETLQRLLGIRSPEVRPALDEASTLINEVLGSEKVDVFLYEAESGTLVAMGTSDTPMGSRQHELVQVGGSLLSTQAARGRPE